MSTTTVPPVVTPMGTVKKSVFDLDKMEKVSIEAQYAIPQPIDEAGLTQVQTSDLLKAYNAYNARKAKLDAKSSIQGADPGVVNGFIRNFRILPLFFVGADGKRLVDSSGKNISRLNDTTQALIDRKAQNAAIWAHIKSNPAMLESLKEAAANSQISDEDGYCPRGTMIFTACKGQYTHPVSGKITNLAQHVLYCQFCQPKDKEI